MRMINALSAGGEAVLFERDSRLKDELKNAGAIVLHEFPFIGALGVRLPIGGGGVSAALFYASAVYRQSRAFCAMTGSHKLLNTAAAYNRKEYGGNVCVAVIDTGAAPHMDMQMPVNRIAVFKDFVSGKEACYDDNGHGTFVAGVLAGNGLVSGGKFSGVAPACKLAVLKAMDSRGEGGAFKILQAMQWIYDNREKYNIRLVCMSFGSEPAEYGKDPLAVGAEALWNSGICVVAAAGNSGPLYGSVKSPGIAPRIITVGGLDCTEEPCVVADFSSRGLSAGGVAEKPELLAPAVEIMSTSSGGGYKHLSGTSVAAPMVAGLAALILDRNPDYTPDKVKSVLLERAAQPGGIAKCAAKGLG